MKVLLVTAPHRATNEEMVILPPLGLAYIAAMLEKVGHQVEILDAFALRLDWDEFEMRIQRCGARLIGITGMTPLIEASFKAAKICRKQCEYVVMGGPHVTVFINQIFLQCPDVDFAVYGEGEYTALELVEALEHGRDIKGIRGLATQKGINPPRELICDLDSVPFPARHLLPKNIYTHAISERKRVTTILTSRGCPYSCIFCDKSIFGSRWRKRSTENVLAELEEIVNKYNIRTVLFYDDLFTLDKNRVIQICQAIVDRGLKIGWKCEGRVNIIDEEMLRWMKRAGCVMVAYGVESANQSSLDFLNKKTTPNQAHGAFALTKKAGIKTLGYFILGIPIETYEEALNTIQFAKELKADYAQFNILSPMPGSPLYEKAIRNGWYREIPSHNPIDPDPRPVIVSENWNVEKLQEIIKVAHQRFYLRPAYILKRLMSLRSLEQGLVLFRAGWKLLRWYGRILLRKSSS